VVVVLWVGQETNITGTNKKGIAFSRMPQEKGYKLKKLFLQVTCIPEICFSPGAKQTSILSGSASNLRENLRILPAQTYQLPSQLISRVQRLSPLS
jgi:hypothetical protein